jgi:hypothetical protein
MAYMDNMDEQDQQKAAAGGVIAGSGGAAGQTPTSTGTGFTNLQQYLTANKGSGDGIADSIVSQGQNAVTDAQKTADNTAAAWGDYGVQKATQAGQDAASKYNAGTQALASDPFDTEGAALTARGTTYGGPKSATEIDGYNDLDKAYQNVKNTATNYAGDFNTQQAGLKQQNGYGSGFAALDTFLGRQDGKDKIQGWAAGVNPGSAQSQVDRVNGAISSGQQSVTDAQNAFNTMNRQAHQTRASTTQVPKNMMDLGIASQTIQKPKPTVLNPDQDALSAGGSGSVNVRRNQR